MTTAIPVIIPAYNEEAVLERLLQAVAEQADQVRRLGGGERLRVIVAANGCRDDTVRIARSFTRLPDFEVLELAEPSKTRAINAAEARCDPGPRIYLDADVVPSAGLLPALVETIRSPEALLVCPTAVYDTSASEAAPRAFYDVFTRLPHVTQQMNGGLYGLTEKGRSRFATFPEVTADDTFVKRLFPPSDRRVLPETFVIHSPRDLRSLINIRTRIIRGGRELADLGGDAYGSTGASTAAELVALVRREPRLLGKALLYAGVVTAARIRARRSGTRWERDDSSRCAVEPAVAAD